MSEQLANFEPQELTNEEDMRYMLDYICSVFVATGSKDDKSQKEAIMLFLNKLHDNLNSPGSSAQSKLMSLMMLRQLSERSAKSQKKEDKHSKLFSFLLTHKLLKWLGSLCENQDPKKQIGEKGKSFFPGDPATGNDFIRLALELVKYWAARYSVTKTREPTAFKRTYDALLEKKVVFPNEYKFFSTSPVKKEKREEEAMAESVRPKGKETARPNAKADISYMYNRLLNFVEIIEEDDITVVENEIRTVHALIEKEIAKYNQMGNEDFLENNDEETVARFFNIREFMAKELEFHTRHIDRSKDFASYITEVKLEAEKLLPHSTAAAPTPKPAPQVSSKQSVPPKADSHKEVEGSKLKAEAPSKQAASVIDPVALTAVSNYFMRLEERSKSPISGGFRKINEELSREKANTINSSVKRSISPLNLKNNITKSMASLKESKIAPIFASPPNLNPPRKVYEGREVNENYAMADMLRSLHKSQGIRRFKTANFKGKSSLFENEHIQIGYKSEPIFEEISGFKVLIKIELFLGNLLEETIKNVSLDFKGDPNVLLYANPRTISSLLTRGEQSKIELMIVPLKNPFPLLAMNLAYQIGGKNHEFRILLPNSVLKLASFLEMSKNEFQARWSSSEVQKTCEFKLCHYLPPDTFTKWFPTLSELTSYTSFATPGSKTDYELYSGVIMLQNYEGLLKVNIRPNLNVVLQLAIEDRSEDSLSYFTYFLETMQQFLKEVE